MSKDVLNWVDTETFGLATDEPILEIGLKITDLDLNVLAEKSWLIWDERHKSRLRRMIRNADEGNESEQYVLNMHSQNNLFNVAEQKGLPTHLVDEDIMIWMQNSEVLGLPMAGSSIHTDRRWIEHSLPKTASCFHYRNVDTSTLKELCRRYNKEVYAALPEKKERHRVMPDLEDSIAEFRHYRDEFLLW